MIPDLALLPNRSVASESSWTLVAVSVELEIGKVLNVCYLLNSVNTISLQPNVHMR